MVEAQPGSSGDSRFGLLDKALRRTGYRKDALIEVLHTAQEVFGFLANDVLRYVARQLRLPPSHVYGVATFYHLFSLEPLGDHRCTVCLGTACYVKRADDIVNTLHAAFGVRPGETTPDGALSVSAARCLGSCGLAPVVVVDGEIIGKETPEAVVVRLRAVVAQTRE
jgi:bidirectional [NiFe] hydrogenase diaphorase subunit